VAPPFPDSHRGKQGSATSSTEPRRAEAKARSGSRQAPSSISSIRVLGARRDRVPWLLPYRPQGSRITGAASGRRRPQAEVRLAGPEPVIWLGLREWGSVGGARPRFRGRSLLRDSASDELLGAAEIRTPAFRRSARARGIVRPVVATSVPAGGVVRVLPRESERRAGEWPSVELQQQHLCTGEAHTADSVLPRLVRSGSHGHGWWQ
jgi:hypothetical protein